MLGALVGGALSFFGGRSARKQSQRQWEINRQDNLPQGIRANAEAAGFNPLVFAGPGVGNGAGYQPTMGHELSTAGQIVTDASLALENQKIRRAELELENKRLEELVKANTLRPTTPGVYGARNGLSSTNRASDNGNAPYPASGESSESPFPRLEEATLKPPARDTYNLYVDVYDSQTERWTTIPNPDLMDAGPVETAYAMSQIGAADLVQNGILQRDKRKSPKSRPVKRKPTEFEQHARKLQSQNPYYRP